MNFSIDTLSLEVGSCVYKLYYGDRFVIVKGKSLAGSIFLIEKGYAGFIAGGKLDKTGEGHNEWDGKNSYYFKFYSYIHAHPNLKSKIEVTYESDDPYKLLLAEQGLLDASIRDKRCLNSNVTAYIPKYSLKSKSYGWISKGRVTAFKKHLSKI